MSAANYGIIHGKMSDQSSDAVLRHSEGKTSVERLLAAIGYPERISSGSVSFTLRVDGAEVIAEEMDGRLVLSHALTDDESLLPTLAVYAAGRMLKEYATLAYGNLQPIKTSSSQAFLWQEVPANADSHAMLRLFETFMDSCDWWRARVDAMRGEGASVASAQETVMILP